MQQNELKLKLDNGEEIILSNSPTSSTDNILIAQAGNGSLLMQLISILPEHNIENHRTMLAAESVEPFIDMLCEVTEYYPKKPKKKAPKKKAKTKK